mgnify:FL=1
MDASILDFGFRFENYCRGCRVYGVGCGGFVGGFVWEYKINSAWLWVLEGVSLYIRCMERKIEQMTGPDIELIRKYIARKTNESEERAILEWMEASPDNPRYMADLVANISYHDALTDEELESRQDAMMQRLNARIDAGGEMIENRLNRNWGMNGEGNWGESEDREWEKSWRRNGDGNLGGNQERSGAKRRGIRWALAAVAAAAAVAAVVFLNTHGSGCVGTQPADTLQLCLANNGTSVKTYLLADNTKVFLKPGSEISYNVSGLEDSRQLRLRGEAYFDVARDSLRPFIVHTENISVKVLGTAFTVSSIPGRPDTEVVLERGKVRILSPEGISMLDLKPNQSARYSSAEGVVDVESCYAKAFVASHFNLVSLEDATLAEIVSALEDSFETEIGVRDVKRPQERYYFNYLKTDSLDDILSVLEFITGANCEIGGEDSPLVR